MAEVKLVSITKTFGNITALKDINIEVPGPAPGLVLNLEGERP